MIHINPTRVKYPQDIERKYARYKRVEREALAKLGKTYHIEPVYSNGNFTPIGNSPIGYKLNPKHASGTRVWL